MDMDLNMDTDMDVNMDLLSTNSLVDFTMPTTTKEKIRQIGLPLCSKFAAGAHLTRKRHFFRYLPLYSF